MLLFDWLTGDNRNTVRDLLTDCFSNILNASKACRCPIQPRILTDLKSCVTDIDGS